MAKQTGPGNPPEWFKEDGREMWAILVDELHAERLDRPALIAACGHYDIMIQALKDLASRGVLVEGDRGQVANRSNQIAREQGESFRKMCVELGLTPAARKKLELELKGDVDEDPVAALRA